MQICRSRVATNMQIRVKGGVTSLSMGSRTLLLSPNWKAWTAPSYADCAALCLAVHPGCVLTAVQDDKICIFSRWIAYPPSARPEVHPFPRRIQSLQREFLTASCFAVVAIDVNLDGGIKSHPSITWGPLQPKRLGMLRYVQVHAS